MFGLSFYNTLLADAHITCAAIAGAAVTIRIFCKFRYQKGLGKDDWCIILALMLYCGGVVTVLRESITNFGRSSWYTKPGPKGGFVSNMKPFYNSMIAAFILTTWAQYACKMSVLFFYRLIFLICPIHRKVSRCIMVLATGWVLAAQLALLCLCQPVVMLWLFNDYSICGSRYPLLLVMLIIDAFIDLFILVLPIRTALGLELPKRTRFAVAGVFALGGFVVFTNILRLIFMNSHGNEDEGFYSKPELWAPIHLSTAILCASLPICKSLYAPTSKAIRKLTSYCARPVLPIFSLHKKRREPPWMRLEVMWI